MSLVASQTTIRAQDTPALSEVQGIYSPDIIIKSALEYGIKDLRANPAQLQMVFASLVFDFVTNKEYGEKERQNAINWFNKTEIPVVWNLRLANENFPCVSFELVGEDQTEETLADVHYVTQEETKAEWEPLTAKFSPTYDPSTGIVTCPDTIGITPTDVMQLVTGFGIVYPVLEEISSTQFRTTAGLTVDFRNSVLKGLRTRLITNIESCNFKHTIRIGCHAVGDPINLAYLYPIIKYCLLRYRRTLLEARGLERSTISAAAPAKDERFQVENLWTRYITLVVYARDSWQAAQSERIVNVSVARTPLATGATNEGLLFSPVGTETGSSTEWVSEDGNLDPAWLAMDAIGANR